MKMNMIDDSSLIHFFFFFFYISRDYTSAIPFLSQKDTSTLQRFTSGE